jgi:hypothetical protein
VNDSGPKNISTPGPPRPPGGRRAAPGEVKPLAGQLSAPPPELMNEYQRIRRAVREEPKTVGHLLLLGDVCIRLGRKAEAKEILLRAIDLDPRVTDSALGHLRTILGEKEIQHLSLRQARIPFYSDAARVLSYPLRGNGWAILVGGGVVFTAMGFMARISTVFFWLPLIMIAGYIASYMMTIIETSGRGEHQPPDYPDFTSIWDSILGPFWVAFAASLIPLSLPVLYWMEFGLNPGILPLIALGILYWPMALMTGAIFQNALAPLNVLLVARGIRTTAAEYFPAVMAIYGLVFMNWLVNYLTQEILPGLLGLMFVEVIGLYCMMVEMHILGCIYYNHERALGWFVRPEPRPEACASIEAHLVEKEISGAKR